MYLPKPFDRSSTADHWLPLLLQRDPFVALVSCRDGAPVVSHLPVTAERDARGSWTLSGHWARANPQWQGLDGGRATAIVHGPHAYVSPRWYPDPARAVPTWNYAVAHARGRIELVEDAAALLDLVDRLTAHFEGSHPAAWRLAHAHPSLAGLARGIVGFRLHVEGVEVALKLNQHHPADKRLGAIDGLRGSGRPDAAELAAWMEAALDEDAGACQR